MNQSKAAKTRVKNMPWTLPNNNGIKNGMWQGKRASYQAIHTWLRKHHKKPKTCLACKAEKKLDWASKTKEYSRNIDEYLALCRSCHIKFDRYNSLNYEVL